MKEKILQSCKSIPPKNLANYVRKGVVMLSELKDAGLSAEKISMIQNLLKADDDRLWLAAQYENTVKSFHDYLSRFPDGLHKAEALEALQEKEESEWERVLANLTETTLRNYMECFPYGIHTSECQDLLEDLPWLATKQRNTIRDYQNYMSQYPGRHDEEVNQAILVLNDDNDWNNACLIGNSNAYKNYLNIHPDGKHAAEANNRIQSSAGRDAFLDKLRHNPNAYGAQEIQNKVNNNVASWEDIMDIFGFEKTEAIKLFRMPSELPESFPPESLTEGSTEVYFWGTPSSGKTCALGSIISSVQSKGIFEPLHCSGYDYMTRLSNIFDRRGFCVFPDSTSVGNIQEMIMNLTDSKKRQHKVTLIDLAGELFRSAYFKENNLFLDEGKEETLNKAMNYLKDTKNNKIHFFVVEYGAQDKKWEGLRMVNYLDNMIGFLKRQNIFRKSTVGVYVLVTKCDMIDCQSNERPRLAYDYVCQELPAFWNTLQNTCKKAGVSDVRVLSYSVGDVFAQNLCKFDSQDTDKVIEKLLTKTNAEGSRWDWLRG